MAALLRALQVLATTRRRTSRLQVWLNAAVLLVEQRQVGDQVLHNMHVRERVNLAVAAVTVDTAQAGEGVDTINVHGAATANTLTARTAESEGRVKLVLDLQKSIENHGAGLVQINLVALHVGLH